eukprot:TRINITY_DN1549_c0_g4_i1.p1 TRINITY_DN1549_c0_g4~~TRINITY_DN1549_c0_g4_i1.p1  ORF type:complete len:156 (+),score=18.62 TRINITY_DN1549_c0_g4_i1:384-851(+)
MSTACPNAMNTNRGTSAWTMRNRRRCNPCRSQRFFLQEGPAGSAGSAGSAGPAPTISSLRRLVRALGGRRRSGGASGGIGLVGIIPLALCSTLLVLVCIIVLCRRPKQKTSAPVMLPTVLPAMPAVFDQVTMVPCGAAMPPPPIHYVGQLGTFCP